ncbi:hypothetical protein H1230_12750 [Paenibacillus sp. 19GGS1-52]|uniref:hypothetical protein n=1 Tax=Paenibacillus sp. 19GGS1-52 TaxID=2758563 RepID=UPI001EFB472E|nr:hypothetical protein [Paenibacillus sp. 19GGS1-52]ULO09558.1 hypothetical protein H1230_12750 [Paenibacillus sp. 19GGS1-52]
MPKNNNILNFQAFIPWVGTLNQLDAEVWTKPMSEGKWSISEMVSHLMLLMPNQELHNQH